jgi:hypothetical protein
LRGPGWASPASRPAPTSGGSTARLRSRVLETCSSLFKFEFFLSACVRAAKNSPDLNGYPPGAGMAARRAGSTCSTRAKRSAPLHIPPREPFFAFALPTQSRPSFTEGSWPASFFFFLKSQCACAACRDSAYELVCDAGSAGSSEQRSPRARSAAMTSLAWTCRPIARRQVGVCARAEICGCGRRCARTRKEVILSSVSIFQFFHRT